MGKQLADTGNTAHVDLVGLQKEVEAQGEEGAAQGDQQGVFQLPEQLFSIHSAPRFQMGG